MAQLPELEDSKSTDSALSGSVEQGGSLYTSLDSMGDYQNIRSKYSGQNTLPGEFPSLAINMGSSARPEQISAGQPTVRDSTATPAQPAVRDTTATPSDRTAAPTPGDNNVDRPAPIVDATTSSWIREQMQQPPSMERGNLATQGWSTRNWSNPDGSYVELEMAQNGTLARLSWLDQSGQRGEGYLRQLPDGQEMVNVDLRPAGYQISSGNQGWRPGGFNPNVMDTVNPDLSRPPQRTLSAAEANQRIADFRRLMGAPEIANLPGARQNANPNAAANRDATAIPTLPTERPTATYGGQAQGFSKQRWDTPNGYQELYTRGTTTRFVSADNTNGREEIYIRQRPEAGSTPANAMVNISRPDGSYVVITGNHNWGEFRANTIVTVNPDGSPAGQPQVLPPGQTNATIQRYISALRRN